MTVFVPVSLEEAFDAFDQCPDAHLLAGGTDFMVEVSFAHRRPPAVVCLTEDTGAHRRGGWKAAKSCWAPASPTAN